MKRVISVLFLSVLFTGCAWMYEPVGGANQVQGKEAPTRGEAIGKGLQKAGEKLPFPYGILVALVGGAIAGRYSRKKK